jgi:MFS family permease
VTHERSTHPLLLTLALGVFAGALDLNVLSPALPALARYFRIVTGDLAWIFTIYLLVTVASIVVASALADRYGRRPIYELSIVLFAVGSLWTILAPTYAHFLLARALLALGAELLWARSPLLGGSRPFWVLPSAERSRISSDGAGSSSSTFPSRQPCSFSHAGTYPQPRRGCADRSMSSA